jgi:hypothetical protein
MNVVLGFWCRPVVVADWRKVRCITRRQLMVERPCWARSMPTLWIPSLVWHWFCRISVSFSLEHSCGSRRHFCCRIAGKDAEAEAMYLRAMDASGEL